MTIELDNVERLHVGLLSAAVGLAFLTRWVSPWSLLLGGAVMGANFWLLRQLLLRLLGGGRAWHSGAVTALVIGKFMLFMGLIAVVFWRVPLDALAFGIGATLLLVACLAEALRVRPALS